MTFRMLISHPVAFDAIRDGSAPVRVELIFYPGGHATYGGFKRAAFGHSNVPIFGTSTRTCIKQCWYRCKKSGDRLLYDNATQVVKLSSEINCLRWASALMELVYDFISEAAAECGTPSFEIPAMRFVKSALAVAENDNHDTYMIEEVIDEADGKFVKYIGNSSAVVNEFQDKSLRETAEFLAFCQHVQYSRTQEMAFIGDYQGNDTLAAH
jgi:Alpha-kinase family